MPDTMAMTVTTWSAPRADGEAYDLLVGMAQGKTGAVPAEMLARHVLAITGGAEWPGTCRGWSARPASPALSKPAPWPADTQLRAGAPRPAAAHRHDGIEGRIASIVGNKRAFFKGLFDGDSDEVAFEHSAGFLKRLEGNMDGLTAAGSMEDDPLAESLDAEDFGGDDDDAAFRSAVEAQPSNGDGAARVRAASEPVGSNDLLTAPAVAELFSKLQVRADSDGGITITAPPEAAATLASLFKGFADKLSTVASSAN